MTMALDTQLDLLETKAPPLKHPIPTAASLGIIPPTEVTQILVLRLGYYDSGTRYTARPIFVA